MFANLFGREKKILSKCEPFLSDKKVKSSKHSTIGKREFLKLMRNKKMTVPIPLHFTTRGLNGMHIKKEDSSGLEVYETPVEGEHFLTADIRCGLMKMSRDPRSYKPEEIMSLFHHHNGFILYANTLYEVNVQCFNTSQLIIPVNEIDESIKHNSETLKVVLANMQEDTYVQANNDIHKLFMSIIENRSLDIYLTTGLHYFVFEVLPTAVPLYVYYIAEDTSILVPWINYIKGAGAWVTHGASHNLLPIFREGESNQQLEKIKIIVHSERTQRVQIRIQHGHSDSRLTVYKGRIQVHTTIFKAQFGKIVADIGEYHEKNKKW